MYTVIIQRNINKKHVYPIIYYIIFKFCLHGMYFMSSTLCVMVGSTQKSVEDIKPPVIIRAMLDTLGIWIKSI